MLKLKKYYKGFDLEILIAARDKTVRSALIILIKYNGQNDSIKDAWDLLGFLENLRNNETDLVIIEWGFFFGDNPEMMLLLKKAYPGLPFIVTGISRENKKEAFDANMDAFYLKSDSPEELLKLINSFRKKTVLEPVKEKMA